MRLCTSSTNVSFFLFFFLSQFVIDYRRRKFAKIGQMKILRRTRCALNKPINVYINLLIRYFAKDTVGTGERKGRERERKKEKKRKRKRRGEEKGRKEGERRREEGERRRGEERRKTKGVR